MIIQYSHPYWRAVAKLPEEDLKEALISGYKNGVPFEPHNYIFFNPARTVSRILDFGHGIGRNFPSLRKHCDELIGYDIPEMNAACRRFCDVDGITLVEDWQQLRNQHFDVVVANLVLQHIDSRSTLQYFLKEIADACDYFYVSTRVWRDGAGQQNIARSIRDTGLFSFERGSVEEEAAVKAEPSEELHFELLYRSKKTGNWRKKNSHAFNLPDGPAGANHDLSPTFWRYSGSSRVRISVIESGLNIGGAEWFATLLAKNIDADVFEVAFLCYDTGRSSLRSFIESIGVNVVSVDDFTRIKPSYMDWISITLFEMLDSAEPDVVLFPTQLLYHRLPKERLSKYKTVVRLSTFLPEKMRDYDFSSADKVMCCSHEQYRSLSRMWGCKVSLVPTGVDMHQFRAAKEDKLLIRRDLDIQTEKVILFVGRLGAEKKRLWLFQRIVERVSGRRADVTFLVVGYFYHYQDEEREAFREFAMRNSIVWLDKVPPWEAQRYYAAADALLSTSDITEGLSNTMLQALASGVVPVTTKSSGMVDIVDHGENGFILDTEDADIFMDALCRVLDMPETDLAFMRESGRQKIAKRFDLCDTVRHYQGMFLELLDESQATAHRAITAESGA